MHFSVQHGDLYGVKGEPYIIRTSVSSDLDALQKAAQEKDTRVYTEGKIKAEDLNALGSYQVTDDFYRFLISMDSWKGIAGGRFDFAMARKMQA